MTDLLVATRTGASYPADGGYRCIVEGPDFALVRVAGDVEIGVVVDLDALPADYVCTVSQWEAAIVPPVKVTETIRGADGKPEEIEVRRRVLVASERERVKWDARKGEVDALRVLQNAVAYASSSARALAKFEIKLTEAIPDPAERAKFAPYVEAKAAHAELQAVESAARAAHEVEKAKPADAAGVAKAASAKKGVHK